MSETVTKIKSNVMRRVYYAYTLRLATHSYTLHAIAAAIVFYTFSLFVSIEAVLYNLAFVKVYNVDAFLYNAFLDTEIWTLICLAAFMVLCMSFIRSMWSALPYSRTSFA